MLKYYVGKRYKGLRVETTSSVGSKGSPGGMFLDHKIIPANIAGTIVGVHHDQGTMVYLVIFDHKSYNNGRLFPKGRPVFGIELRLRR